MVTGMQIVTLPDIKQLVNVLPAIHPTFFGAVPQIWYKLKAGIEAQLAAEKSPAKKRLAEWAIAVGRKRARLLSDRQPLPAALRAQHALADRLVLAKIRERLGLERVRFAATGAAAIDPDALEFVLGLGLPVCELWGMSELSCAATVNPPDAIRIGTVGVALPNAELRIADDGELLVRGPLVMKGYRNEPEKTAEALDADGWLHTGDIASIDADGYVRIVDRKKELMINAAGKNMSPANIEGTVKVSCPLVGSVVAIGDDRPYVVALLTLDPDAVAAYAKQRGLADASPAALADDPDLRATIEAGIKEANTKLSRVEQIKKFTILPDVWEPGGEEVTPTMKLKRKPIAAKYAAQIEELYATSAS
jgi:long-subunit acyl-CoA synthetase (AMP-forming)